MNASDRVRYCVRFGPPIFPNSQRRLIEPIREGKFKRVSRGELGKNKQLGSSQPQLATANRFSSLRRPYSQSDALVEESPESPILIGFWIGYVYSKNVLFKLIRRNVIRQRLTAKSLRIALNPILSVVKLNE